MSNVLLTLLIAFVVVTFALLAMGIGYFSGKKKILSKRCGINPNQEKDEACGKKSTCEFCQGADEKSKGKKSE